MIYLGSKTDVIVIEDEDNSQSAPECDDTVNADHTKHDGGIDKNKETDKQHAEDPTESKKSIK